MSFDRSQWTMKRYPYGTWPSLWNPEDALYIIIRNINE